MARPTWEQMQAAQAEADRVAALRPIEQMCHRFGEAPRGITCGNCVHLVDKANYFHIRPHRYYKCRLWAETFHPNAPFPQGFGASSDWRVSWRGCGRHAPHPGEGGP